MWDNREGDDHEMLRALGARTAVDINKRDRTWETLGIKTMQDGYVQVVKAVISTATGLHRLRNPFAGYKIRWPDDAKPSVNTKPWTTKSSTGCSGLESTPVIWMMR
jgi:hypothetical protein